MLIHVRTVSLPNSRIIFNSSMNSLSCCWKLEEVTKNKHTFSLRVSYHEGLNLSLLISNTSQKVEYKEYLSEENVDKVRKRTDRKWRCWY
jgi:hypothetical protein